jgi:K+:H+ antiporter
MKGEMTSDLTQTSRRRTAVAYSVMTGGAIVLYLVIRSVGESMSGPAAGAAVATSPSAHAGEVYHVLLALVLVIATARVLGSVFRYLHQPPVVGEIIAGIILGPSVLGSSLPAISAYMLPTTVAPFLNLISQVGIILYMFLVGLELDPELLRRRGHATVAVSHASIIAPFLLGAVLALFIYPKVSSPDVPFTSFSLFMGVTMSVTAFPVLARILTDRRIHNTRMGAITLTCAAVDDVTAWCLLAFVVGIVESRASGAFYTIGLTLAFIAAMLFAVRPAVVKLVLLYGNRGRITQGLMASIFVAVLLSSVATDLIGIHAIFGAFVLGAIIPHDSGLAREFTERLEDLVIVLFLPAFFAFTGMRTQIGLLGGSEQWIICAAIILVASLGKFGGSAVAARFAGLGWRDATALGILMNTRGLMELIVLNIGLELKVISPVLFAMLVLMALVTTFATTPILHFIRRGMTEQGARKSVPRVPLADRRPILVPIANPRNLRPLLNLAMAASLPNDPPPHVLAMVRRPAGGISAGLRELDHRVAPRTAIASSVEDYAREKAVKVSVEAIWTDSPSDDVLAAARARGIGWIVVGSHRSALGSDVLGGEVRHILERARSAAINVAVMIHGDAYPADRVAVVLDSGPDGLAALDLGSRIARKSACALHAILADVNGRDPGEFLTQLLRDAGQTAGSWLYSDVLITKSEAELAAKATGNTLIVGAGLVGSMGLNTEYSDARSQNFIVVQGSDTRPRPAQRPPEAHEAQAAPRAV